MRKTLSLLLSVIMLAVFSSLITPIATGSQQVSAATVKSISNEALNTRFLNMLNHSFVYNDDFNDVDTVVNNSVFALINLRDSENEEYIKDTYVKGFVNDMYGIEIADMSQLNADFPQKEGYVYIIPRGYTTYSHKIVSVKQNEDVSYTVVSEAIINNHDSDPQTYKVVSLFVKNETSSFGYNIIYSNIINSGSDI